MLQEEMEQTQAIGILSCPCTFTRVIRFEASELNYAAA